MTDYYAAKLDEPSNSTLKWFRETPYCYWYHVTHGTKIDRPAFALGKLCDMAMLEPERFRRSVVRIPDMPMRGRDQKELFVAECQEMADLELSVDLGASADDIKAAVRRQLEAAGRILCSDKEWAMLQGQVESLKLPIHTQARKLVTNGQHQRVLRWTDEETGITCKGRPDIIIEQGGILVDLKSTLDASADGFRRALWSFGYEYQDAMYYRGARANGIDVQAFYFVLVEKEPPYHWNVVEVDEEDRTMARLQISSDLRRLKECLATNNWPGHIGSAPAVVSRRRRIEHE